MYLVSLYSYPCCRYEREGKYRLLNTAIIPGLPRIACAIVLDAPADGVAHVTQRAAGSACIYTHNGPDGGRSATRRTSIQAPYLG